MGCLFSDPYDEEAAAAAAAARDPGSVRRTAPGPSGRPAPGPIQRSIASLPPTVVMPSPARPPPPVEPRRESAPATQPPQSEPKPVISQPRRDSGLAPADRRNSASGSQAITRAELAQHGKSSTEPWTAIKGLVYDLSGFLSKCVNGCCSGCGCTYICSTATRLPRCTTSIGHLA